MERLVKNCSRCGCPVNPSQVDNHGEGKCVKMKGGNRRHNKGGSGKKSHASPIAGTSSSGTAKSRRNAAAARNKKHK